MNSDKKLCPICLIRPPYQGIIKGRPAKWWSCKSCTERLTVQEYNQFLINTHKNKS